MRFFKDLINIFYPNLCVNCDRHLLKSENTLCSICKNDAPIIDINNLTDNVITSIFYGKINIINGYSLLIYRKDNITKNLIHQLKYKNRENIGEFIADWVIYSMNSKGFIFNIDCIIPVPLHKNRLKQRGYNQLTLFGQTLSKELKTELLTNNLIRTSFAETQTLKNRFERFNNTNTKFSLKNKSSLENKHILLIDDVVTTGATLEACCNELLNVKNIKISILTMAYTQKT